MEMVARTIVTVTAQEDALLPAIARVAWFWVVSIQITTPLSIALLVTKVAKTAMAQPNMTALNAQKACSCSMVNALIAMIHARLVSEPPMTTVSLAMKAKFSGKTNAGLLLQTATRHASLALVPAPMNAFHADVMKH
jgi:hypothetical protein